MHGYTPSPRPLFLLPPGHQARHSLLGMLRASERLGQHPGWIEVEALRTRLACAGGLASDLDRLLGENRYPIEAGGFTHAVSYGISGVVDFLLPAADGSIESMWSKLGMELSIWWTDHPNWMSAGAAMIEPTRAMLSGAGYRHFVKSRQAADETREMLRWSAVEALPAAEDYEVISPADDVEPVHDVVVIASDISPVPHQIRGFLEEDDPDPEEIDRAMIPLALSRFKKWTRLGSSTRREPLMRFASELLEARACMPMRTVHELATKLGADHGVALEYMTHDGRRWFRLQSVLRQVSGWRRSFWLAWLGQRVDLGVYGGDAASIGLEQSNRARHWVDYKDYSRVYGLGKCAIAINQSNDEAGVTHRIFQIAGSGVACVHHATAGLADLFDIGREVLTFSRGPELLDAVDRICADPCLRQEMASLALSRARTEHSWEHRLERLIRTDATLQARAA